MGSFEVDELPIAFGDGGRRIEYDTIPEGWRWVTLCGSERRRWLNGRLKLRIDGGCCFVSPGWEKVKMGLPTAFWMSSWTRDTVKLYGLVWPGAMTKSRSGSSGRISIGPFEKSQPYI
jgi:hypothetical protein